MKTIILAGGFGTRISEETETKPKPMVEIGDRPILWHIMKIYGAADFREFIVALGYKGRVIKEYFLNFFELTNDLSIDLRKGKKIVHHGNQPPWTVHLVDTGLHTMTGGRVARLEPWIGDDRFMLTYGDGVADIDIARLVEFHEMHGKAATVTAVRPPARFGNLVVENDAVREFTEKPQAGSGWINGGFFVLEPRVFAYLDGDESVFEREPLERLAEDGELMAFQHEEFWHPMDTLRDKRRLDDLWTAGSAPWKRWES